MKGRSARSTVELGLLGAASLCLCACLGSGPVVRVTVTATPEVAAVVQLRGTVSLDERNDGFTAPGTAGAPLSWPRTFAVELPAGSRGKLGIRLEGLSALGGLVASGLTPVALGSDELIDAAIELGCAGPSCVPVSGPPSWVRVRDTPVDTNEAPVVGGVAGLTAIVVGSAHGGPLSYVAGSDTWSNFEAEGFQSSIYRAATLGPDGRIYAAGGLDASTSRVAQAYDPAQHRWLNLPSTNLPHASTSMASLDGRVLVLGGSGAGNPNAVESYVPGASAWTRLADLPIGGGGSAVTGGALYVFGGGVSEQVVYDAAQDRWNPLPDPSQPRTVAGVAAGGDGRVYLVGGTGAGGEAASVEAYSPTTGRWDAVPSLSRPRRSLECGVGADGRVYAIGGTSEGVKSSLVEAYGPRISLSVARGRAGEPVVVRGDNFAPDATVYITLGDPGGLPLVLTRSDAKGALPEGLSVSIPALPAGAYTLTAVDNRAHWAARASLSVD